jgi:DNA repair protein SbcD/Mre11
MKIAQFTDLHFSPKTLEEVDRCMAFAVDAAIEKGCDAAVLSGDTFDHRIELHSPAVSAVLQHVRRLAEHMPVLVLQGTFSHDAPGSLDVFKTIGGQCPVFVADRICQVALVGSKWTQKWVASDLWVFGPYAHCPPDTAALFSCLPAVNKGALAAAVGAKNAAAELGEHVFNVLKGWAPNNLAARADGVPTVVVSHGTVSGSITEHGVPMAGLDHEYTTGALFAAEASAVMLGHIHQTQTWEQDGRMIGYGGSIARLHFGELTDKGFLLWNVGYAGATVDFIVTPARSLLQIDYPGPPDMAELATLAEKAGGTHVRVRYVLDEEHRHAVDKAEIKALFAAAAEIKIEARINPITRTRSEGMNSATSLAEKLVKWCGVTATESAPLVERLAALQAYDPEKIVSMILNDKTKQEVSA